MSRKSTRKRSSRPCSFPECTRPHDSLGYCQVHARQLRKGETLRPIKFSRRPSGTPPRIIWLEKPCEVPGLKGPCHECTMSKSNGYAQVWIGCGSERKMILVHKYMWEKKHGPVNDDPTLDLVLDHVCRNRACCNVDHLRIVTRYVNSTENNDGVGGTNLRKTHCLRGHPFDEANTKLITPRSKPGKVHRECRECRRLWKRREWQRSKSRR